MLHATVAVATQYRGFELEDAEAEQLADATSKLMSHYGKSVSGETSLWLGFIIAVGSIEGPKIFGLLMHLKAMKQRHAQQQQPPNVVPLRPNGDAGPIIDAFPTQG